MHTFMEAAGFGCIRSARSHERLMRDAILHHEKRIPFITEDERKMCVYLKYYAPEIGLGTCVEMDEEGNLHPQYAFPFYIGRTVSMKQPIDFEKHAAEESYGGICDDPRIGSSIIFYLINGGHFVEAEAVHKDLKKPLAVQFSALAKSGTILLPVFKTLQEEEQDLATRERYLKMVSEAREGKEEAIEALTEDDMQKYNILLKRVQHEDVFSIVDTYFQPAGIECDIYNICGNVISCEKVRNSYTSEEIWKMQIEACDVYLNLCVGAGVLEGEPSPGARFRGQIWLQGYVEFP